MTRIIAIVKENRRFVLLCLALHLTAALAPRGFAVLPVLLLLIWLCAQTPSLRSMSVSWGKGKRILVDLPANALLLPPLALFAYAALSAAWSQEPLAVLEKLALVGLLLAASALLLRVMLSGKAEAFQAGTVNARIFLFCSLAGFVLLLLESIGSGLLAGGHDSGTGNIGFMFYAALAFLLATLCRSPLAGAALLGGMLAALLLVSANQAAMLGMAAGISLLLLLPRLPPPARRILPWLLLAAFTALPFIIAVMPPPDLFRDLDARFASLYLVPRFEVFGATLSDILTRPWLGYGFHAARIQGDFAYAHPHNYALQLWLELGIIGLLLFHWMLASLLRATESLPERIRWNAQAMFFCALCGGAFSYNAWRGWWLGMLCMLICLFVLFARDLRSDTPTPPAPP